jgi:hypothetical protein
MIRKLAFVALLGTLACAGSANAAVVGPGSAPALGTAHPTVTPVRWVCTRNRCVWRPNYAGVVVVPPYARGWGPPRRATCFYERRRRHWILVCP